MFTRFSQDKSNYEKGQMFPFLIAIIVVVIILAMITVNLGQISIFRTDVSNAADAAALSGASVLSGTLLGLSLKSEQMCGVMIVEVVTIILAACTVIGIPVAIAIYIALLVNQLTTYIKAFSEGIMGWSNAKKTALQYAFNNAGVDEPRPSFERYLLTAYGISDPKSLSATQINNYYQEYLKCDSDTCRLYGRAGFSKFMEEHKTGFAKPIGEIKPGRTSSPYIKTGYGWTQQADGSFVNSYGQGASYNNYENYVEVELIANSVYPLDIWNPIKKIKSDIKNFLTNEIQKFLPWWLKWILEPVKWVLGLVMWIYDFIPGGLTMDMKQNTDDNPILVTVRRYKRDQDLGLWKFRYKTTSNKPISAQAGAVAFRERGVETIEPVTDLITAIWNFVTTWDWGWFDSTMHLFETKLIYTR